MKSVILITLLSNVLVSAVQRDSDAVAVVFPRIIRTRIPSIVSSAEDVQESAAVAVDSSQEKATTEYDRKCMAKAETGPCTAFFRLWTYNFKKGQCEQFIYGGCHGTENQYRTKENCEKACKLPTARSLACYLPLLEGTAGCSAPNQRFYFNTTSERCEQFLFKGCVGNTNNFLRLEDCQRKCYGAAYPEFGKDTDAVELPQLRVLPAWYCSLPAKAGPCEASIPRVFFNVNSEACEDFVYGGCEGNRNNFNNHPQCQAACYSRRMVLARP